MENAVIDLTAFFFVAMACGANDGACGADDGACGADDGACGADDGACGADDGACGADDGACGADDGACGADDGACGADDEACGADDGGCGVDDGGCVADDGGCGGFSLWVGIVNALSLRRISPQSGCLRTWGITMVPTFRFEPFLSNLNFHTPFVHFHNAWLKKYII